MSHLAACGLRCPVPVAQKDGTLLGRLAGRPAALVTFLEGNQILNPSSEACAQVGHALAQLHKYGESFWLTRPNALGLSSWKKLLDSCHHAAPELCDDITQELAKLQQEWPAKLPAGIIHGDLFPDNVLFYEGLSPGIIDFYFSCNAFLAYDLAIAVNAWCFDEHSALHKEHFKILIEGYERERPLLVEEKKALPVLLRGAAVRFLLTRLSDWGTATPSLTPRDPQEYVQKLLQHRALGSASAYGLRL